jgi:hypothetical protein
MERGDWESFFDIVGFNGTHRAFAAAPAHEPPIEEY